MCRANDYNKRKMNFKTFYRETYFLKFWITKGSLEFLEFLASYSLYTTVKRIIYRSRFVINYEENTEIVALLFRLRSYFYCKMSKIQEILNSVQ